MKKWRIWRLATTTTPFEKGIKQHSHLSWFLDSLIDIQNIFLTFGDNHGLYNWFYFYMESLNYLHEWRLWQKEKCLKENNPTGHNLHLAVYSIFHCYYNILLFYILIILSKNKIDQRPYSRTWICSRTHKFYG